MIKIDVISGFLGAGKTTLIRKLISESLKDEKIALIENEFGKIGIDSGFLKGSGVEIKEIDSGCICCSLVGDFEASLKEVADTYNPERIIIEPSGVGKLSDVVKAVKAVEETIGGKLNSKITVVDVTKCKLYIKNFGEFFLDQVQAADIIILSRMDTAKEKKIEEAMTLIKLVNPNATIVTTPISDISGEVLLETIDEKSKLEEYLLAETMHHHHEHHHHEHGEECNCGGHHDEHEHHHEHGEDCGCGHHHHADEVFQSYGIHSTKIYTEAEIKSALEKLADEETFGFVLRAKGMVQSEGKWLHFDYVPEEMEIRTGEAQVTGKICVIGANINEDKIKELF